jgi:hypothetical protein
MRQRRGRKPPFPACNASRGRRWQTMPSKQHCFVQSVSFFLLLITVNKTESFCTKCAVSFKQNGAKKKSFISKWFNFQFVQLSSQFKFWF